MSSGNYDPEIKAMLDDFSELSAEEAIIVALDQDDLLRYRDIFRIGKDIAHLKLKLARTLETHKARGTIFWDDIKQKYERAENAELRELSLGLRKDKDGIPVLVEYKHRGPNLPPFLQQLLGGDS